MVEDNPDDAELSTRVLREHYPNARISTLEDGYLAVEYTRTMTGVGGRPSEPPDLILLDLKLPKVAGLDVLRAVRDNMVTQTVPVVVFSSSDEVRDVHSAYERGANTYVQKPNDYDEYVRAVRDIAHYWFGLALIPT